jgi:hypothetical protein
MVGCIHKSIQCLHSDDLLYDSVQSSSIMCYYILFRPMIESSEMNLKAQKSVKSNPSDRLYDKQSPMPVKLYTTYYLSPITFKASHPETFLDRVQHTYALEDKSCQNLKKKTRKI